MSRPAKLVAGVDGCPAGWVATVGPLADADLWLSVAPTFAALVALHPRVTHWAVDIPIGLADDGPRECDTLARKRLGPKRGSSVFPAPPRSVAAYANQPGADYVEACRLAAEATGKKISKQAWNITPKIAEVRGYLASASRPHRDVFECHPELCFARLAGGEGLTEGKKAPAGERLRRQLLSREFGADCVERFVAQATNTKGVGIDDALDAMACWTAAARAARGQAEALPADPHQDAEGLEIAIHF